MGIGKLSHFEKKMMDPNLIRKEKLPFDNLFTGFHWLRWGSIFVWAVTISGLLKGIYDIPKFVFYIALVSISSVLFLYTFVPDFWKEKLKLWNWLASLSYIAAYLIVCFIAKDATGEGGQIYVFIMFIFNPILLLLYIFVDFIPRNFPSALVSILYNHVVFIGSGVLFWYFLSLLFKKAWTWLLAFVDIQNSGSEIRSE